MKIEESECSKQKTRLIDKTNDQSCDSVSRTETEVLEILHLSESPLTSKQSVPYIFRGIH